MDATTRDADTATPAAASARPNTAHPARRSRTIAAQSADLRLALMRLTRRMRQERADTELSPTQLSALGHITLDGPLTLGGLADLERVTAPSMNRTVNLLVDAGLVTRGADSADGRRVLLASTDAGEAIVLETRRRRDAWLTRRLAALTADERETLVEATNLLRRLSAE